MTGFFHQFLVLLAVGFRIDGFARRGRFGDPVAEDEPQVQRHEREDQAGHDEDVDRKKPAQGRAADGFAAEDELRQPFSDERHAARLFRRDDDGPGGILVPSQQLAGETHHQGEAEQQHAGRPVHFARILVGTE